MLFANLDLGEVLWSLLVLFLMIQYLLVLFSVVVDLFRSDDLGGVAKAGWAVALLVFPLLAVIAYLVVRGQGLSARAVGRAQADREVFDSYVRDVARTAAPATELKLAKELLDEGAITEDEFSVLRERILT